MSWNSELKKYLKDHKIKQNEFALSLREKDIKMDVKRLNQVLNGRVNPTTKILNATEEITGLKWKLS